MIGNHEKEEKKGAQQAVHVVWERVTDRDLELSGHELRVTTHLSFLLAITFILPALYHYASASIFSQQEIETSQQEYEASSKNSKPLSKNSKPTSSSKHAKSKMTFTQQSKPILWKKESAPARQPLAPVTRPQVPLPPLESEDEDIEEVMKESEDEEEASEAEVKGKQRERGYGYKSEDEDENDDEDEDNNDNDNNENDYGTKAQSGGKRHKKEPTRKIVKKAAWRSGYMQNQPDDIWVLQTLAWWNEQVFGDENGCVDIDRTQDDLPPTSTIAGMAAHREA
ncbi:hypothetical protein IW261DRAFT_1428989 [Armillaria novae-zelandiae]|uniref:Uncharacterized protein n=1 Tax=Armillaria novae-zelandiae TaxID=153914 RepID=A0AA39KI46_9AGAR|nr:hypothetical protein IW261DRAFT_1428989 [Armillaria novae-zelandiae]